MAEPAAGQWPAVAAFWDRLGSPLRPVAEDLAPVRAALGGWVAAHHGTAPRGLILGVTPELYRLPWPDPALVRAVDRTPAMIDHVWPGPPEQVLRCDWRELSVEDATVDIALCDGGFHLLDFSAGQTLLVEHLTRAVAPGGLLILRLFVPPARPQTPGEVLDALFGGRIGDLNQLKLALGTALQAAPETGVALRTVWDTLHAAGGDWPSLATRLGWDRHHLEAIDAYRDSPARYHFVSETTVLDMTSGAFTPIGRTVGTYPMADQCPTLVLRRS